MPDDTFTFDDVVKHSREAWGQQGVDVAHVWAQYNRVFFGGVLKPIPLLLTHAQPYGRRVAFCMCGFGRCITLNVPSVKQHLLSDNGTVLHEQIHQYLQERGEYASHDGQEWRDQIMRLHLQIVGSPMWAGKSIVVRQGSKVVRMNAPSPDGVASLNQDVISRWPDGDTPETRERHPWSTPYAGIDLGRLGELRDLDTPRQEPRRRRRR